MSNYKEIKERIFENLQKKQNENNNLSFADIKLEVEKIQQLIKKVGIDIAVQFYALSSYEIPTDNDFERMIKELETDFDISFNPGFVIQGDKQRERDTTWWTGLTRQTSDKFYWNRYKKELEKTLPVDPVIRTIDIDTDNIMDNLANPNDDQFQIYGMAVGYVQSGKTANYSSIICKAADAGYKFIVVIAGDKNNLRKQTQERINESFIGIDSNGKQIGVGVGNTPREKLPKSLTTLHKDFNKQDADRNSVSTNFETNTTPIVLVIKKNGDTLKNVITWLENQYRGNVINQPMLMIDDESDYASVNTKNEEDPASINRKIRAILKLFSKSCYLAFTATPYANIFIDHKAMHEKAGEDLFPSDFIYTLDAPNNYFGAKKIFADSPEKYLVFVDDYQDDIPPKHKIDYSLPSLPESLYNALETFIFNIAIRILRGDNDKHNSMMIHATRFTQVHQKIAIHVENYLEDIKQEINVYGKLNNSDSLSEVIANLKKSYQLRNDISDKPKWENILLVLCDAIKTVVVREVHQSTSVPLEYKKDRVTNAIVIGGTSISRGFTLEGLSVSYFLRTTVFYDTLMQMGRWFGYRTRYEDICKIYLTREMAENFKLIVEATDDLIDDLKRMRDEKMTPEDFGLAVKYHPDSGLQITARNKQKNTKDKYIEMKLDGHCKETSCIHKDEKINKANLEKIESMVNLLVTKPNIKTNKIGNSYLWKNISKNDIFNFVNEFQVFTIDPYGFRVRMPKEFIKEYIKENDELWDVALYSGDIKNNLYTFDIANITISQEQRQLNPNISKNESYFEIANRQISSGTAESIVLSEDDRKKYGSKRKEIRINMKKPLLMLHVLQVENKVLPAFGISFPGGVNSGKKAIRLKMNSVFIQNLDEMLNDEIYDD